MSYLTEEQITETIDLVIEKLPVGFDPAVLHQLVESIRARAIQDVWLDVYGYLDVSVSQAVRQAAGQERGRILHRLKEAGLYRAVEVAESACE